MDETPDSILFQTEQCVLCGMCLPYCPTYYVSQSEAESPRGRISIIKALMDGSLSPSRTITEHINNCLQCRACEPICPANVPYGKIIDSGISWLFKRQGNTDEPVLEKFIRWMLRKPYRINILSVCTVFYRRTGLRTLLKITGLSKLFGLDVSDNYIDRIQTRIKWHEYYSPDIPEKGKVALFLGCIAQITDTTTIVSTIEVLNKFGYRVYVPENQRCCGALDYHCGDQDNAMQMVLENIAVFEPEKYDAIITTSSGCGGFLQGYEDLEFSAQEMRHKAHKLSRKIVDINDFLAEIDWPKDKRLKRYNKKILHHIPCSLSNVMHIGSSSYKLLSRIPGLEIYNLPPDFQCCGAGGIHQLRDSKQSITLKNRIQEHYHQSGAECIVTSNSGCALHLSCTSGANQDSYPVCHPVSLLNQCID